MTLDNPVFYCNMIFVYSTKLHIENNRAYQNRATCGLLKIYATLNHGTRKTIAWTVQAGSSAGVEVTIGIKDALKKQVYNADLQKYEIMHLKVEP